MEMKGAALVISCSLCWIVKVILSLGPSEIGSHLASEHLQVVQKLCWLAF